MGRHLIKIITLAAFFVWPYAIYSSSYRPAESTAADALADRVRQYRAYIKDEPVTEWSQVALNHDNGLVGLNSYYKNGDITELYSFVPIEDRDKFPNGELILIYYKPIKWPKGWTLNTTDIDPDSIDSLSEEQRKELKKRQDAAAGREKPIRYLIYRNEDDEYDATWWYEDDVQKMLAETGIHVPPPTPYRPNPDTREAPLPRSQSLDTDADDTSTIDKSALASPQPNTTPPEKEPGTSSWWIWALLAGIPLIAVIILVRRSRSKQ